MVFIKYFNYYIFKLLLFYTVHFLEWYEIKHYKKIILLDLQTDKHDDVGLALLGLVGLDPRVHQLDQLLEDCLLDDDPLVQA